MAPVFQRVQDSAAFFHDCEFPVISTQLKGSRFVLSSFAIVASFAPSFIADVGLAGFVIVLHPFVVAKGLVQTELELRPQDFRMACLWKSR